MTNLLVVVSTTACTVMASCYLSVVTYTGTASVVASCYLSVGASTGTVTVVTSCYLSAVVSITAVASTTISGRLYYREYGYGQLLPVSGDLYWSWFSSYLSVATSCYLSAKVGEVPTFQASDTNTDLPIVSADLFHEFQQLTIASSLQNEGL